VLLAQARRIHPGEPEGDGLMIRPIDPESPAEQLDD